MKYCKFLHVSIPRSANYGHDCDDIFLSYADAKLSSVPDRPVFALDPCLVAPFDQTMRLLGYNNTAPE